MKRCIRLSLTAVKMSFTTNKPKATKFSCTAKFRYRQEDTPVEVELLEIDQCTYYI